MKLHLKYHQHHVHLHFHHQMMIVNHYLSNQEYHVLYVNVNGEYVPIAKTSFIIQTSLHHQIHQLSKPATPIK